MVGHPFELSVSHLWLDSAQQKRLVGTIEFDREGAVCFGPSGRLLTREDLGALASLLGSLPKTLSCHRCCNGGVAILRKENKE